ncbi:hypothetical protein K501DRAFT_282334 [Backusella circina FSU 941]|nr:hypothetical protein K501DRAFT_282334 [Backusella circina FSU 941]
MQSLRSLSSKLNLTQTLKYSSIAQTIPIRASKGPQRLRPIRPAAAAPLLSNSKPTTAAAVSGRSRRDEEITSRFINYVDDKGELHNRVRLDAVLNEFDRARYFLVEVDPTAKPPVCRLFDKKQMFEKEKQSKKKKQTAPESILKEIVFGWNVSAHDMDHKLNKAMQFLEKGNKVKIDIVYKRGQKRVDKETQNEVVQVVSERMNQFKMAKKPLFTGPTCSMQYEKK